MAMNNDKLASFLNDWLTKNERSVRWLARKARVSHTVVDDMSKGHVPKLEYLEAVEHAMGLEVGTLIFMCIPQRRGRLGIGKGKAQVVQLSDELVDTVEYLFATGSHDQIIAFLKSVAEYHRRYGTLSVLNEFVQSALTRDDPSLGTRQQEP